MYVLGIGQLGGQDSSAVLLKDCKIKIAIEEERLTRIKHIGGFPKKSIEKILNSISVGKNIKAVLGGTNRQNSVQNGVLATDLESTLICVHDAARPFVTEELITASVSACDKYDGAIIALPCSDTVKLSDNSQVKETIDRNKIWLAQTPQTFNRYKLMQAYENADRNKIIATDESTLMEAMGFSIGLVEGHPDNFKITTQDDWERAEAVTFRKVQRRAQE